MFCKQMFSTVSGYSSLGARANPSNGACGTPFTARTPTTRTPPCEFANDEIILGSCSLTLASNVLLYSTRMPSLNRAHTSRTCCTVMALWKIIAVSITLREGQNHQQQLLSSKLPRRGDDSTLDRLEPTSAASLPAVYLLVSAQPPISADREKTCINIEEDWWTRGDSNPRPPRCERGALPAELLAHEQQLNFSKHRRPCQQSFSRCKQVGAPRPSRGAPNVTTGAAQSLRLAGRAACPLRCDSLRGLI